MKTRWLAVGALVAPMLMAADSPNDRIIRGCILDTLEFLRYQNLTLSDNCVPLDEAAAAEERAATGARSRSKALKSTPAAETKLRQRYEAYRPRIRAAHHETSCSAGDYFHGCEVRVTQDGKIVAQDWTDDYGHFELTLPPVKASPPPGPQTDGDGGDPPAKEQPKDNAAPKEPGPYFLSTEADGYTVQREIGVDFKGPKQIDLELETRPVSLLTRAIVGYDQSGATSAKASQKFFFDMFVTMPFPWQHSSRLYNQATGKACGPNDDGCVPCVLTTGKGCIDPDFGPRVRVWADAQVSSVPQTGALTVADIASGPGLAGQVATLKLADLAQSVQFLIGGEVRLGRVFSFRTLLPSFDHDTKQKFTVSFIGSFGATTPVNPPDAIQLFKYQADAGLPAVKDGTQYVAFVPQTRDRFYRQYYAGFRLQTLFFNRFDRPMHRFPGMFDVTYGQNEFITAGHLHGGMFRLDAYWPLPFEQAKYINLFGTAFLRPTRDHDTSPLLLEPAPTGTPFPAPNVAQIAAPQMNRDYYRIGAGIDFISFAQYLKGVVAKGK